MNADEFIKQCLDKAEAASLIGDKTEAIRLLNIAKKILDDIIAQVERIK